LTSAASVARFVAAAERLRVEATRSPEAAREALREIGYLDANGGISKPYVGT
jgi:hypothetical protein